MKKNLLFSLIILTLGLAAQAQKGNNQFIAGIEAAFPVSDFNNFNTGIGVLAKGYVGLGERSQFGISTGYTAFKLKGSTDSYKVKTSVIPILASYRHNLSLLYLEPQLGYGIYSTTIKTETGGTSTKVSSSEGGFTWSMGAGVQFNVLDLGVRYQAGYPGDGTIGYFGVHAAYVFRSRR